MFLPIIFIMLAAFFYYEDSGWTLTPVLGMDLFWSAACAMLALLLFFKVRRLS